MLSLLEVVFVDGEIGESKGMDHREVMTLDSEHRTLTAFIEMAHERRCWKVGKVGNTLNRTGITGGKVY